MKLNRSYLFIGVSSFALFTVILIQVNWILQSARIKEEIFNEKANMVLSRTADALKADTLTYQNLETGASTRDVRKVDSMFKHYMNLYNIQLGYYFNVKHGQVRTNFVGLTTNVLQPEQPGCYQTCIQGDPGGGSKKGQAGGLELKLVFPDKEQFIFEEMGIPFISSIVLIAVVLIMFWRTVLSLLKEKIISEHTTDFLNNMTHEFKTPLTNIALAGKMILKETNIRQEDKIKHYSGIILSENEKLSHQVEQVLSMTALERGEIPLQKTELDLHQLVREALKCISVQIENTHGRVRLSLDAERFVIMGDRTHLTNAFCNLVDNAIKYSPEEPEISIHTSNCGNDLMLAISDKGKGIDPKYHEKIFEKFFRIPTGNIHDVKGFGLGLAYVKKIIELHGGTIALLSEKGKGTTFTIKLPNA